MGVQVQANHGYNIGLELTQCYSKYFDHREVELHGLIDTLKMTNMKIKIVSDVMNKLAHGKQSKKLDLNNDEIAKKCAYLIQLHNPTVFENKIHGVPDNGVTLDQQLQEIVEDLKTSGLSDAEINLPAILDRLQVPPSFKIDTLSEDEIDIVIQGLDSETKMLTADLNECMMKINNKYEDRSQMTENARQVLKEADEHIKSIIHKTTNR